MSHLIILGAGASCDFEWIETKTEIYTGVRQVYLHSTPLPLADEFFLKAIEFDILTKNCIGLLEYIESRYGLTFEQLKTTPLSIEQAYLEISHDISNLKKSGSEASYRHYGTRMNLSALIEDLLTQIVFKASHCQNHCELAHYCVRNLISVVSFNWDTLMDDALYFARGWNPWTGYGFRPIGIYEDKKEVDISTNKSPVVLLKPHGSINWYRYSTLPMDEPDLFTGEPLSKMERTGTGIIFFSTRYRSQNYGIRLEGGYGFDPRLKKHIELDLLPPGEKYAVHRSSYVTIRNRIMECVSRASKITIIGFAMKSQDSDSLDLFREGRSRSNKRSIKVELVGPSMNSKQGAEQKLEIARDVFGPCEASFVAPSFKEYVSSLPVD